MSDALCGAILGIETLLLCLRIACPLAWLPAVLVAVLAVAGARDTRLGPVLPVVTACGMVAGGLHYMHDVTQPVALLGAAVLLQSGCLCGAGMARRQAGVFAGVAYGAFAALALLPVWIAYRTGALVPHAVGTILLILLVLLLDRVEAEVWPAKAVRVPGGTSILRPVIVLAVAASALLAAGLAVRPVTVAAETARTAWSGIAARFAQEDSGDAGPAGEGLVGDSDEVDLSRSHRGRGRGAPRFHVVVQGNDALHRVCNRPLYLRFAAADTYEGQKWWTSFPRKRRVYDRADGANDGKVVIAPPDAETVTYTVYTRAFVSGLLLGIPSVNAVHLPVVDRHTNDALSSPLTDNVLRCAYTMTSSPVVWADVRQARPVLSRVPAECSYIAEGPHTDAIRAEAERVAGTVAGPAEIIDRLLAHFSSHFTYSLAPQNTADRDALENFVFHSREGDCRLFATALALMLRSRGVPARLVVGYAGGEFHEDQGLFSFYQQDAHTWVEVPFEEQGWVSVDPTPPQLTAPKPAPASGSPTVPLASYPQLAELLDNARLGGGVGRRGSRYPGGLSLCILAGLVFAAGIILLARTAGTRSGARARGSIARTPPPGFYAHFCRHFAKGGQPRRPGRTPREFLDRLKHTGRVADEFDDMIEYLYDISYKGGTRRAEFEREVKRRIRGHRGRS